MSTYVRRAFFVSITLISTATSVGYARDHSSKPSTVPKASSRYPTEVGSNAPVSVIPPEGLRMNSGNANRIPLISCGGSVDGSEVAVRLAKQRETHF